MSPPRRSEPLRAERLALEPAPAEAAPPDTVTPPGDPSANGHAGSRFQRLAEGVRSIRVGGGTLNFSERTLMILGGVIAPLGIALIFLGWYGAAHTPYLFEQVPYVVSGGLLGLGLVFLGSFFYFAHWLTELVKEHRQQSAALIEAIARLEEVVRSTAGPSLDGRGAALHAAPVADEPVALVATHRGTMAHRADCVVVAGKDDLRAVDGADGLLPCKLCDPYAAAPVRSGER